MKCKTILFLLLIACFMEVSAQEKTRLKKKDRRRDVELVTTAGPIVLRLYDSTPVHRDNFLRLVKSGFYDSVLFHRVIRNFMIQAGDPNSKRAMAGKPLGDGDLGYTLDPEFRPSLFHKRGVLAAARESDSRNPQKKSSASQFYIVQGRRFTDHELDSVEVARLKGYRLPEAHRAWYRTTGGTPQLDQNYTVFGEVVQGMEVVDKIASGPTSSGKDRDRPLEDVRILSARLVKRKMK